MAGIKYWIIGLLALFFTPFIFSCGCIDIEDVDYSTAQSNHYITVTSTSCDECSISYNGVAKKYDLPDTENKINLDKLQPGNNHIVVVFGDSKVEFDVNMPNTEADKTNQSYDSYNTKYWKDRAGENK